MHFILGFLKERFATSNGVVSLCSPCPYIFINKELNNGGRHVLLLFIAVRRTGIAVQM